MTARRLGLALVIMTAVVCAGWGQEAARAVKWDGLERVDVRGTVRLSPAAVRAWAGVPVGARLWNLDPAPIIARVEDHRWIKRATIRKRLPHTLVIDVVERAPFAIAHLEGRRPKPRTMLIDREGVVLEPARVEQGFPVVRGARSARPDGLSAAAAVLAAFKTVDLSPLRIDELVVDVTAPEAPVVVLPDATEVRFGQGEYALKWRRYAAIHADAGRRVPGARIVDLRFQDRAVVTEGHEAARRS